MVESLFGKVTETSAFCNSAEKRFKRTRYVLKISSPWSLERTIVALLCQIFT